MRKGTRFVALLTAVVVCICTSPLSAAYISGTSTATLVTEAGSHYGWYLYEININWGLDYDVSHWDFILKPDCESLDHLIEFDTPAGYSTSKEYPANPTAMGWTGYFERGGDPSDGVTDPIVKYNDPFSPEGAEPGEDGYGTFSFYANIIPEDGSYNSVLLAKAGQTVTYGDLTGDYPSCTIIPEPATILLLGLGALALLRKRRA